MILKELEDLRQGGSGPYPTDLDILVDERFYFPNAATTGTFFLQIDRPVLITSIIASIPSGTAGLLSIGSGGNLGQLNVTPGSVPLSNISMIMYQNDPISLAITGGTGLIALWFMGLGLRGNKWRRI